MEPYRRWVLPPHPPIVVYGGGGHAKVLLDLLAAVGGYRVAGMVDDHLEPGSSLLGCPVLGGKEVLSGLVDDGVSMAVNGVGGDGAWVGKGATVNIGVVIGEGARIGNSAVVKSDVAPGAVVHAGQIWPERRPGAAERPPR